MVQLVLLYQQLKETVRKSIIMFVPVLTPMKLNQTELVVLHYLSIRLQLHHASSLEQFLCVVLQWGMVVLELIALLMKLVLAHLNMQLLIAAVLMHNGLTRELLVQP